MRKNILEELFKSSSPKPYGTCSFKPIFKPMFSLEHVSYLLVSKFLASAEPTILKTVVQTITILKRWVSKREAAEWREPETLEEELMLKHCMSETQLQIIL